MRKVIVVIGLVFFTGACSNGAGTSPLGVEIGKAQTLERMSEDECNSRLETYSDALTELSEVLADVSEPSATLRATIKETVQSAVDTGRYLIEECGYLDPEKSSRVGDYLDELEQAGESL